MDIIDYESIISMIKRVDTSSRPIIKKDIRFEVHAKISVMALTPLPLSVIMTLFIF